MSKVVKRVGRAVGRIVRRAAPFAALATPFLPGVGGAVAGLFGKVAQGGGSGLDRLRMGLGLTGLIGGGLGALSLARGQTPDAGSFAASLAPYQARIDSLVNQQLRQAAAENAFRSQFYAANAPRLQQLYDMAQQAAMRQMALGPEALAFRRQFYAEAQPSIQFLRSLGQDVAQRQLSAAEQERLFRQQAAAQVTPATQAALAMGLANAARQQLGGLGAMGFGENALARYGAQYAPLETRSLLESLGIQNLSRQEAERVVQSLLPAQQAAEQLAVLDAIRAATEARAREAQRDVQAQQAASQQQLLRELRRSGIDPQRLAALSGQIARRTQLNQALAMNQARQAARQQGAQARFAQARFGRQLPSLGLSGLQAGGSLLAQAPATTVAGVSPFLMGAGFAAQGFRPIYTAAQGALQGAQAAAGAGLPQAQFVAGGFNQAGTLLAQAPQTLATGLTPQLDFAKFRAQGFRAGQDAARLGVAGATGLAGTLGGAYGTSLRAKAAEKAAKASLFGGLVGAGANLLLK